MPTVIRDDSIGQALGMLGGALLGNPKSAWEAYAFKERIKGMQADTARSQIELEEKRRQQQAQDALVSQFGTVFQPGNFNIAPTIEAPRPAAGFVGPMPGVDNPADDNLDQKLSFARAAATNAIMRGGSPDQALSAAYAALGQGQVFAGGIPTNEAQARQVQTMLTGQIPNAQTPMTEEQRRVLAREQEMSKLKESIAINENGTLLTPEQARVMNVPANEQGQFVVRPPADPNAPNAMFSGDGVSQQAFNILLQREELLRNGQPVPPQLDAAARLAWNELYGIKTERRLDGAGNTVEIPIYPSVPPGFTPPGATAAAPAPAPAPGAGVGPGNMPMPGQPTTQAQAQPVPQPLPQAGQPGAGQPRVLIPGKPQPPPEHLTRDATFIQQMDFAAKNIEQMLDAGYQPSFAGAFLSRIANSANEQDGLGAFFAQLAAAKARGEIDPQGQMFETQTMTFLNAVLRDESGAAVPIGEYPKYIATLIPRYGDQPDTIAWKRNNMRMAIEARRQGLKLDTISAIALGGNPAADVLSGQGGAGAGAPAQPPVETDRVKLRQDADAAIARIEASSLPPREKEQRKAAIMQRFNQMIGGQ